MTQIANQCIWRHEPLKTIYLTVAFASLLARLPFWFLIALVPSFRPRASWTVGRTLTVRAARVFFGAVFNTGSFQWVRVDPRCFAQNEQEVGLVWIDASPDLIQGTIKRYAGINEVLTVRVPAYWSGARDIATGHVGQAARPDEKVILAFHGKLHSSLP